MTTTIYYNQNPYTADLLKPIDISVSICNKGVTAWNVPNMEISPVVSGDWIGDVNKGSSVNFNNILFNPHAHSTHTECIGHISKKKQSINDELSQFFFISKLITINPEQKNTDYIITANMLKKYIQESEHIDTLVIRTSPNKENQKNINYSNTNPAYLLEDAAQYLNQINIKHLLIDLPSIDKEQDEGLIKSHKAFWGFPNKCRKGCTITELIYVPNHIKDGLYLLNLQFVPFRNDASPSRPILFTLNPEISI
jgi:arylformamidase